MTDREKPPGARERLCKSEDEAIRRAGADPEAFTPLYEEYFERVFLFVSRRIGDRDLAADVTQQTFLNALANIHRYEFRGLPFSSWLLTIALNQCKDVFRKSKKMRMVALEDLRLHELCEDVTANQWDDWKRTLPAVLEQLRADELRLIKLRYFDRRPFREVAEILGLNESTTKGRTYRILERIKRILLQDRWR